MSDEIICPACHADIDDGGVGITLFDVTRPPGEMMIRTTICRQCARSLEKSPWATAKRILERIRVAFRPGARIRKSRKQYEPTVKQHEGATR